jgi:hypothetical protein
MGAASPVRGAGRPTVADAAKRGGDRHAAITNFAHLKELVPQMKLYRETLAAVGKPFPEDAPITRECYVGPTNARALEECRAALQYKYAAYSSWGLDSQSDGAESFQQPFEDFVKDRFIIGDKSFVGRDPALHELLGVNHFLMRVQWVRIAAQECTEQFRA